MNNDAVMPVARAWPIRANAWAIPGSVLLVAAASPFERPLPGLAIGGFAVTTVELAMMVAFALGAVAWLSEPASILWKTPITLPALAVLLVVLIAAWAAPEFRGNAFRFWGRLGAAWCLFLLTVNVIVTRQLAGRLIATLLAVGSIVGVLAVLELAQLPSVMDGLRAFRPGFHVVGGQVRATSTLLYPTITSMYLEVVFALGLYWLAANGSSSLKRIVPAFAALTLVGAGIIATFTRAGLITVVLAIALVGGLTLLEHRRWTRVHTRLALLATVLGVLVLASRSPQMLVARMSIEGSQDWYGASYIVPPTLTLPAGSLTEVPVTLANQGRLTWQSRQEPVFALSYHWLTRDTEEVVIYDGLRTPFAEPVEPGESVPVAARVRAPGYPGSYVLVWDVVHEHRTWLSVEGVYPGRTAVNVEGAAVTAPLARHGRMPSSVMRLPRMLLWKTAFAVAKDHPWLGVGPDNFRQVYGRYLGLAIWDTRVHANNTYLEVLADTGVVGVATVGWLIVAGCVAVWNRWRETARDDLALFAAVAAACTAIAVHGLVDSFFTFTPTYVVFAFAAALLIAPMRSASSVSSAALGSASSVSSAVALALWRDRSVALVHPSVYANRV